MAEGKQSNYGVGYYAMRLALTRSISDENEIKQEYEDLGIQFVVTEVGGTATDDFQAKLSRSVYGASVNSNIIEREPLALHALFHATEEAKNGILPYNNALASLALKVAIVRQDHWIAVAIFGESAIHPLTHHERCGLGVMHI